EWVLALGRDLADRVRLFEHPLRLLDDLHADRGHRDFGAAALEELDPELFLELLDGHRQRRLADETGLRGAAEVALARDRYDVLELCQRHGRSMIARRRNPVAGCRDALRPGAPASSGSRAVQARRKSSRPPYQRSSSTSTRRPVPAPFGPASSRATSTRAASRSRSA